MRRAASQNQTVGIKLLSPMSAANLSVVDHDIYVYPTTAMTDSMKYQFLNGSISVAQSNRTYDWSVALSAGPFSLAPSQTYRVAYAFIGGSSEAIMFANADSAQVWYNRLSGISEESDVIIPKGVPMVDFSISPNPSISLTKLSYTILHPGKLAIGLYDISGQLVSQLFNDNVQTTSGRIELKLNNLPNGIYFVKLATEKQSVTKKLLLVK